MGLIDDIDAAFMDSYKTPDQRILKAPFGYQGGKQRSVKEIIPRLPCRAGYIEPFGGSGSVLLAKAPCALEVFNDAYSGVTDFYTCIRDQALLDRLIERLELTLHSREEFVTYKATWKGCADIVERAARWYAMNQYSFACKRDCWGRSLSGPRFAGRVQRALPLFPQIHERMKNVTIENRDAFLLIREYDHPDHVFYLDPPYIDSNTSIYETEPDYNYHRDMLEWIFTKSRGFYAVSGYANRLYDSFPWDNRHTWRAFVSSASIRNSTANQKNGVVGVRHHVVETLWIKESL